MKKPFNLKKFSKHALSLVGYFFLTFADGYFAPLSLPLLSANIYVGLSPVKSFALYMLPFLFSLSPNVIICAFAGGAIVTAFYLLTAKSKRKPSFSLTFVLAAAITPYCVFGNARNVTARLIIGGLCLPLCFVLISSAKTFIVKGLKYRLSTDEIVSAAVLFILAAYGAIRVVTPLVYESFAIFCVLFCAMTAKRGFSPMLAIVTALPLFFFTNKADIITPLALYGLIATTLAPSSKLACAMSILATKIFLWNFTDIYDAWNITAQCYILVPVCVYLFIPESVFRAASDKMVIYKDNNLEKNALNRNRASLAAKLFEISSVFDEMSFSVKKLAQNSSDEQKAAEELADELFVKCCSDCKNLSACRSRLFPSDDELEKIITLATAKGRLNLADLPTNFSSKCAFAERFTDKTNELIADCEREFIKAQSMQNGRDLLLSQTNGLSEVLKNMAVNMSLRLEIKNKLADALSENLFSVGIYAFETLVFGDDDNPEVNVLLPEKQISNPLLLKAVNESTGHTMAIVDIFNVSEQLSAITLKKAPAFDAAFSVAQKTKSDKSKSGDTHSVTKISEGKFLIALNDGMGSGEKASGTSAAAISLIESFYKADLSSETTLSTVNKILSFNGDDNFTALDVGVIDLFSGNADFIKIGSPYSFVITKNAVKIIEGSSLPLGILDEIHPTVCKTKLDSGDVVVFVSDGISDAFGSSSDLIDFLSAQRALNPKSLADNILQKAVDLNGGQAKDDMTAFCVRVFKKTA